MTQHFMRLDKLLLEIDECAKGNDMRVNTSKPKQLPINFILQTNASVELTLNNNSGEKVNLTKLLEVRI